MDCSVNSKLQGAKELFTRLIHYVLLWIELDSLRQTTGVISFGWHDSSMIVANFTTRTLSFVNYARAIARSLSANLNAKSPHYFRWRKVQRSLERWKEGERTWEQGWEGQKIIMAVYFMSAPIEWYFNIQSHPTHGVVTLRMKGVSVHF